jgi:hypothetical protein
MSNTRYLEINSSYRNRNMWPLPGNFGIPIAQSGNKNKFNAEDPISSSSPSLVFNGSFRNDVRSVQLGSLTIDVSAGIGSSSGPKCFIITSSAGIMRTEQDFYSSAIINVTSAGPPIVIAKRIIDTYEYLGLIDGKDTAKICLTDPLPDIFFGPNPSSATIDNPTEAGTSLGGNQIYIPLTPLLDNFWINCILYNVTRNEYRKIVSFSGFTGLATVSPNTTTWIGSDDYVIRKSNPSNSGIQGLGTGLRLSLLSNGNSLFNNITINVTNATRGVYNNIQTTTNNAGIGAIASVTVDSQTYISYIIMTIVGSGYIIGDTIVIPAGSLGAGSTAVTYTTTSNNFSPSSNKFQLNINASPTDNDYVGGFIRMANVATVPFSIQNLPAGQSRRIVKYDGINKIVTVNPAFTVSPSVGDSYEILPFTRDNSVPFTYTGSTVSQQEAVCYEIELLNLVLPNRTLNVGKGGRIAFYPFVYVELTNVSGASAGNKNIIYSNNPNATSMLFRAAIDDIPNPTASPFIKIDSDGMKQTIKFKINDNLHFSVRLPSGEIFETIGDETFGPSSPNELKQISATFSLRRL